MLVARKDRRLSKEVTAISQHLPRDAMVKAICPTRAPGRAILAGKPTLAVATDRTLYLAKAGGEVQRTDWGDVTDIRARLRYSIDGRRIIDVVFTVSDGEPIVWPVFSSVFTPEHELFDLAVLRVLPGRDVRTKLWEIYLDQVTAARFTPTLWSVIEALCPYVRDADTPPVVAFGLTFGNACLVTARHVIVLDRPDPPHDLENPLTTFSETSFIDRSEITNIESTGSSHLRISTPGRTIKTVLNENGGHQVLQALV